MRHLWKIGTVCDESGGRSGPALDCFPNDENTDICPKDMPVLG